MVQLNWSNFGGFLVFGLLFPGLFTAIGGLLVEMGISWRSGEFSYPWRGVVLTVVTWATGFAGYLFGHWPEDLLLLVVWGVLLTLGWRWAVPVVRRFGAAATAPWRDTSRLRADAFEAGRRSVLHPGEQPYSVPGQKTW